ncbi:MAG: hypothetical protein E3J56_16060 [Candidatus Aminicenantes bacterium]|nr:MAG: hypothetical protein E3J56_16060 [Candidatus Aminicenantes bacterium]
MSENNKVNHKRNFIILTLIALPFAAFFIFISYYVITLLSDAPGGDMFDLVGIAIIMTYCPTGGLPLLVAIALIFLAIKEYKKIPKQKDE